MQTSSRGFVAGLVVLGGSVFGLALPLVGCRRRADQAVDRLTVAIAETVEPHGTTRMSDSPPTGVVDKTSRLHGVSNGLCGVASSVGSSPALAESRRLKPSLGAEYLSRYPEESGLSELRSILASSLPSVLVTSDVIGAFHQRIVQDFDDGSTVRFKGWLFSRSELRLYAAETLRRRTLRTPYREGMFPIEDDGTDRYHWTGPSAALDVTATWQPRNDFRTLGVQWGAPLFQTGDPGH